MTYIGIKDFGHIASPVLSNTTHKIKVKRIQAKRMRSDVYEDDKEALKKKQKKGGEMI